MLAIGVRVYALAGWLFARDHDFEQRMNQMQLKLCLQSLAAMCQVDTAGWRAGRHDAVVCCRQRTPIGHRHTLPRFASMPTLHPLPLARTGALYQWSSLPELLPACPRNVTTLWHGCSRVSQAPPDRQTPRKGRT